MPTIEQVLNSPTSSNWLKSALQSGLNRDCVDAAHDAKLLAMLLGLHRDKALGRA